MKIVTCRCGALKTKGDPCASCGKGLRPDYLKVRNRKPICVSKAHGYHDVRLVNSATMLGRKA